MSRRLLRAGRCNPHRSDAIRVNLALTSEAVRGKV